VSIGPAAPAWLAARPIAHRGLHAAECGIVENSVAAAAAAIVANYAIECDVQITQDAEAIVFHDETLDRLTAEQGELRARTARELTTIPYRAGEGRIAAFADFLAKIGGRVPLIVEIKSRFDGDMRLAARVADLIADYSGPLALQSFDPAVLHHLRAAALEHPLGLIAQAHYEEAEWPGLNRPAREALATLADYARVRPDFLAWNVADLPHAVATLWRAGLHLPLLTWTVRTAAEADLAARFADQIIFEGFAP
jgi:glycerophosphoryl diester phosphodiesterase